MKHSTTILLLFMLALTQAVHANAVQDSIRIYFHDGSAALDLSLRHNRRAIDDFVSSYQTLSMDTANRIHSILIESHASPSGTVSRNKQLAQKRAASLLQHLRTRISLPDSLIHIDAKGVDWEGLITLIEQDPSLPAKEAVLHILRHTPLWIYNKEGRIINGRKKQLMDLQGGRI